MTWRIIQTVSSQMVNAESYEAYIWFTKTQRENLRPVPEPDPEFKDVDGIVRYISIWFLGHLCKMLGIKNTYCKLYEQELEKLRVDNPELDEEDDETLFNDIFGDENSE